jgi:hypothetical protein
MRSLVIQLVVGSLLGSLAGCLSAPTGRDPATIDAAGDDGGGTDANVTTWPPPSPSIVAITAGDLGGDGKDDIIAADAGSARVFLLRGGVDIDPARNTVTTASISTPVVGLRPPAALTVAVHNGQKFVVLLDNPTDGARLTIFNAQLAIVSQTEVSASAAPGTATVTLAQTGFGMSMNAVFGSLPDAVFFVEGAQLSNAAPMVLNVPETGATAFASVLAVGGYIVAGTPGTPRVFVSEPTLVQRADTTGPGTFTWSTNRAAGSPWTAQTVADVTGDTFPDVIGFAPESTNPADICVQDVHNQMSPTCYDTQFGMDTASLVAGPVVAAGQTDVILAHVNPQNTAQTAVFVVARLRVAGSVTQADGFSPPTMFPVMDGMLALAQLDGAGKEIIVVGRNAAIVCARSNGAAPVACAP